MIGLLLKQSDQAGQERYRRAALTSALNVFSQAVNLATGLISVPLALEYLGVERFGMWMALSAALAFVTFTDMGLGIGLQDQVSKLTGKGNLAAARRSFFSAMTCATLICVTVMVIAMHILPASNIPSLLSLNSQNAIADAVPTAVMVVFVFSIGLVSGVVQRAFAALQEGFYIAAIQAFARIVSLVALFVVVENGLGLPALVFVIGGVSASAVLVFGLPILLRRHRQVFIDGLQARDLYNLATVSALMKVGVLGLGASVAIFLVNSSAQAVLAFKFGAEEVVDYAVLIKLVGIPSMLATYYFIPFWPAITEAKAKNDFGWILSAYRRLRLVSATFAIGTAVLFTLAATETIQWWTGTKEVVPSGGLLIATIAFAMVGYWNALLSVFLNGLSRFKSQATYGLLVAIIFTIVAIVTPSWLGKEAVVFVVTVGFAVRCLLMQLEVNDEMKRLELALRLEG